MKIKSVIIASAVLASAGFCIAGPFDPPRFYPPPPINSQLQQFQADNQRRQMEQTLRELRERDMRLLQQAHEDDRRKKQILENVRQSAIQPQQK